MDPLKWPAKELTSSSYQTTVTLSEGSVLHTSLNAKPEWNECLYSPSRSPSASLVFQSFLFRSRIPSRCIGQVRFAVERLWSESGFSTHIDFWEQMKDPVTNQNTSCFMHLAVHLVPGEVEPFSEGSQSSAIRLVVPNEKLKQQFGLNLGRSK